MGKRFFPIFIGFSGLLFTVAALFVIFFFRVFPDKTILLYPTAFGAGILFGLTLYLPIKYLLEKK